MRPLRSTSLRLAAAYAAVFAVAVAVLAVVTVTTTRTALRRELDRRIQAEVTALVQEYRIEGMEGVVQAVRERDSTPGALNYGLQGPHGEPLVGRLADVAAPVGWSTQVIRETDDNDVDHVRVLVVSLWDRRLLVGQNLERISRLYGLVLRAFVWAFFGVILLGGAVGLALSRDVERRFAEISAAAQAIIDGDMARRIPLKGRGDDLDAVAATLNRMLDRIGALMGTVHQVSSDIAHDLRTPLTRLRQKLEASLRAVSQAERTATVEAALQDMDAILEIFAALLRIAQIEGGARRAGFRSVDLGQVAAAVAEAFAPSAEEGGRRLEFRSEGSAFIHGDKELLTQMMANLVENGLTHTAPGAVIEIGVAAAQSGACLYVRDDGPGIPVEARGRVLDRFVRLEHSRSTPGSGLGLALVAAVARLHDAEVSLDDAAPGLIVRVSFPRRLQQLGGVS